MSPGSPGASHERPAGFAGRNGTRSPELEIAATQPHVQSSRTAGDGDLYAAAMPCQSRSLMRRDAWPTSEMTFRYGIRVGPMTPITPLSDPK